MIRGSDNAGTPAFFLDMVLSCSFVLWRICGVMVYYKNSDNNALPFLICLARSRLYMNNIQTQFDT